jgi:hypothetical protein
MILCSEWNEGGKMLKSFILFVSLALTCGLADVQALVPDGLALIKTKQRTICHGFVAHGFLISCYHCLGEGVASVLVFQDDLLVDFTKALRGVKKHPSYNVLPSHTGLLSQTDKGMLNVPFDIGAVKLKQYVKSAFLMDPSKSLAATRHDEVGAGKERYIVKADIMNLEVVAMPDGRYRVHGPSAEVILLPSTIGSTSIFLHPQLGISFGEDLSSANTYVEGDILSSFGDNGMPLVAKLNSGHYLVLGLFVASTSLLPDFPAGKNPMKNLFAMARSVNTILARRTAKIPPPVDGCTKSLTGPASQSPSTPQPSDSK